MRAGVLMVKPLREPLTVFDRHVIIIALLYDKESNSSVKDGLGGRLEAGSPVKRPLQAGRVLYYEP